jgi:hypothetical protein
VSNYPRETIEFQPIDITIDGQPAVAAQYQLVASPSAALDYLARPAGAWTNVTTLGSKVGFLISGLAVGRWLCWAKLSSAPETPVILVGAFIVN